MSQNESKAGSELASIQAAHLTLKLSDLEYCSPPYPLSPKACIKLIPRSEWASYSSQTSKRGTYGTSRFGWYSVLGESWMSALLESIETPAQAVEALQKIKEKIAFYRDKEEGVYHAFRLYCQRLVDHGIVEQLTAVPNLPKDIWSITTRFLLWSLQFSSPLRVRLIECLLRKIMLIPLLANSITNESARGFTWNESNQRKRTKNMPAEANPVKSWIATSYVKTHTYMEHGKEKIGPMVEKSPIDGNASLITVSQFKIPSAGNLESFAWEIADSRPSGRIFCYGFAETLEQAAEDAYVGFYKTVTHSAFESAMQYLPGREVILLGNELTSEEFLAGAGNKKSFYFLVQMPQADDRDGTLFCLNWHTIHKTKRTFKIEKVNGKVLTLEGGTKIDVDAVLCYPKAPQQYIQTEVLCSKCGQLGLPYHTNGLYAHGKGYECGPCINNSVERGELSDGQFDL